MFGKVVCRYHNAAWSALKAFPGDNRAGWSIMQNFARTEELFVPRKHTNLTPGQQHLTDNKKKKSNAQPRSAGRKRLKDATLRVYVWCVVREKLLVTAGKARAGGWAQVGINSAQLWFVRCFERASFSEESLTFRCAPAAQKQPWPFSVYSGRPGSSSTWLVTAPRQKAYLIKCYSSRYHPSGCRFGERLVLVLLFERERF